ncbi:helix-turn-helix domain-containing protein [Allokutzneria oryzae]|uniref:Helix-turn-helix domain-containing protein n=1 Tax=Allokutzneria oryzae TaxID=1378989 RepID=A0ABV6A3J4_9PSEU
MSNVIAFPARPAEEPEPEEFGDLYEGPTPDIAPEGLTYTVGELAYLLNLSTSVTEQYLTEGVIPGSRIGGQWVASRKRLATWLDSLPREGGAW